MMNENRTSRFSICTWYFVLAVCLKVNAALCAVVKLKFYAVFCILRVLDILHAEHAVFLYHHSTYTNRNSAENLGHFKTQDP